MPPEIGERPDLTGECLVGQTIALRRLSTDFSSLTPSVLEQRCDHLLPVIEYPFEVAPHREPVRHRAEYAKRQLVIHDVHHARPPAFRGERVGVMPQAIRSADLLVTEDVRRIPSHDPRPPPYAQPVPLQAVFQQSAGVNIDRLRGQDLEIQPGRRDLL